LVRSVARRFGKALGKGKKFGVAHLGKLLGQEIRIDRDALDRAAIGPVEKLAGCPKPDGFGLGARHQIDQHIDGLVGVLSRLEGNARASTAPIECYRS
jgi:hypothetical protein